MTFTVRLRIARRMTLIPDSLRTYIRTLRCCMDAEAKACQHSQEVRGNEEEGLLEKDPIQNSHSDKWMHLSRKDHKASGCQNMNTALEGFVFFLMLCVKLRSRSIRTTSTFYQSDQAINHVNIRFRNNMIQSIPLGCRICLRRSIDSSTRSITLVVIQQHIGM
ncbi:unnamed protein product [Albugo candida]|uniref:Uncharacterized protein n=1 Tax=Albugo candida TaxID=65357 RepID=A0A024GTX2_9STRA|nr:unnamed protein product [Albugo candida]|eukprot:CCI50013.1 unnamed protein product [Albugo candida]